MKITIETKYGKCQVIDENIEFMDEAIDLVVQALKGLGFAEENIAEALLDKAKEMNKDKIVLVV
jgi:Holliday junction resolvasome RuvABC DNA-binding subunit